MHSDVKRVKLAAELAEIEEELSSLERDRSIPAARKLVRLAYCRHRREKKLLEIKLVRIGGQLEQCERQFEYSKTQGAQKQWRDREMMRRSGAALGGGTAHRYDGRRYKRAEDRGPEDEALRKLKTERASYRVAESQLYELLKRDPDFESLITDQPRHTKHADHEEKTDKGDAPSAVKVRQVAPGVGQVLLICFMKPWGMRIAQLARLFQFPGVLRRAISHTPFRFWARIYEMEGQNP